MSFPIDLTGLRFGRLTVLTRGAGKYGRPSWMCVCDCGTTIDVGRGNLRSGASTSCGCYQRDNCAALHRTHGLSKTRSYASWTKMMQRCYDPRHPHYASYGGTGVKVCRRWHFFTRFYEDMGERPAGTTIDRVDGAKGYSLDNCRWATRKQQANNTKSNRIVRFSGEDITLAELADRTGIQYHTLRKRINRMSVEKAVSLHHYARG